MSFRVTFSKDRQKFSAAHFTLFSDGSVERLHGHNYQLVVSLEGKQLKEGLLFPFHEVKPTIQALCDQWDEMVLLPSHSAYLTIKENGEQLEVHLHTLVEKKFYSFPKSDVVCLPIDNVSCENLAHLWASQFAEWILKSQLAVHGLEVSLSESTGQTVTVSVDL